MSAPSHSLANKLNVDVSSIAGMITLLREYEQMCLSKQDFSSAHEAKIKVQFLKSQ
jgi:hypothetical protein